MIKAVIFDMDGVIIDSEPIQSIAYESVLKEYGVSPAYNTVGIVHTPGVKGSYNWPIFKEKYNIDEDINTLTRKKRTKYLELIKNKRLKSTKGLIKLLETLDTLGIKKAIATGAPLEHVKIVLNNLGIYNQFETFVSGEDVENGKPSPDTYLIALKRLKINPEFCIAIEDSEAGVLSAKGANIKVIAIPNKYTDSYNFSKADKIVKSLNDINIELLRSL